MDRWDLAKRICLEACNLPGDVGAKKGAHLSVSPNQWQDARTNIFLELEVNQKAPNTPSLFVCQIPPVSRSLASAIWRTGSPRALPLCPPGFELPITVLVAHILRLASAASWDVLLDQVYNVNNDIFRV